MTTPGIFHDPYLIGNGRWCSSCFPAGPPSNPHLNGPDHWIKRVRRGCNECAGAGRIVYSAEAIVAVTAAAARASRGRTA